MFFFLTRKTLVHLSLFKIYRRFDDEAFTHLPNTFELEDPVSDVCPTLSNLTFTGGEFPTALSRRPVKVAVGYTSPKDHDKFVEEMANILACRA